MAICFRPLLISMCSIISGCSAGDISGLTKDMVSIQGQVEEPIDAWFCLGDLHLPDTRAEAQDEQHSIDQLLTGQISDVPVYLALRDHIHGLSGDTLFNTFRRPSEHASCKILEPMGMITLPSGLRVAFISGIDPTDAFPLSPNRMKIESASLERLKDTMRDSCKYVDVLFTFEWPKFICQGDSRTPRAYMSFGSEMLRAFLNDFDARYIISIGEGVSYEREAFVTPRGTLCQFSSLPHRSTSKEKSIFRLKIGLGNNAIIDTHGNPPRDFYLPIASNNLEARRKRSELDLDRNTMEGGRHNDSSQNATTQTPSPRLPHGYVCNVCHVPGHHIKDCPDRTKRVRSKVNHGPEKGDCWFCLANPATRKHLVVDIGEHAYLALAHGPLIDDHLLIIPIEHWSATLWPDGALADEITQYQERLCRIYACSNIVPIFICLQQNPMHHWHMTSLPVSREKIDDLRSFLLQRSAQLDYPLEATEPTSQCFFKIVLPKTTLSYTFKDPQEFFPSQLGRQLIGEFLDVDRTRLDWKQCTMDPANEIRQVEIIKRRFFE